MNNCSFLGQVTFVEALDTLMPGFDPEITKLAQRVLINPRKIDYHTGVLAKKVRSFYFYKFVVIYYTHTEICMMILRGYTTCRLLQQKMGDLC
jgi:hypothetical protein